MERWHAKLICGVIMTVAMPICFLLPIKMADVFSRWGSRGQYVLDLLTCFAGGVFLASYLVFMAPAVRVLIEDNLMKIYNIEYPLPDTIIGIGFFMMLLLDKFVKTMSTRGKKDEGEDNLQNTGLNIDVNDKMIKVNNSQTKDIKKSNTSSLLIPHLAATTYDDTENDHYASARHRCESGKCESPDIDSIALTLSPNHMSLVRRDSSDSSSTGDGVGVTLSPNHMSISAQRRSRLESELSEHHPSALSRRQSIAEAAVDSTRSVTRSLVMMLALSIDSVLEGMTIGLKKSVIEVWAIFVGIIIHESVIAFCLGLQLVRIHTSVRPVVLASIVYTIMNPLGLLIATLVYETSKTDRRIELANGILQAITAGCFIYIVFYEILEGQIDQDTPLPKILATLVGYIFLASFAALPGSSSYTHSSTSNGYSSSTQPTTSSSYINSISFSSYNSLNNSSDMQS